MNNGCHKKIKFIETFREGKGHIGSLSQHFLLRTYLREEINMDLESARHKCFIYMAFIIGMLRCS